ncbi:MAG TPA: phosphoribosylglycinamide formyltransferase [Alphaproteobacteria bacterium]|jgi:phosphoribosylglycinamide formyltransferase-1|nr:phosphoribosylglycinamide formyltransferase [Alphaproteobacteria bacterium]
MARLKIGVVISGRGSNLQALIDACADPKFPAEIVSVISNVPDAAGLARAQAAGIPCHVVDSRDFKDRAAFDAALDAALQNSGVKLVCLAGFMRLLSEGFVSKWRDWVINIHPSLIPAFTGLNTHERVIKAGARFTGCTVHFVRPEMDNGPIIIQAAVAVRPDDTPESLAERVLEAEHRIYPEAVRLIALNRVRVRGDVVLVGGAKAPEGILINPSA